MQKKAKAKKPKSKAKPKSESKPTPITLQQAITPEAAQSRSRFLTDSREIEAQWRSITG